MENLKTILVISLLHKFRIVFFVLCVGGLVDCAFASAPLEVKSGEVHTLWEVVNIHSGGRSWISVGGKRYEYVLGLAPYYRKIPGRNLILFITTNRAEDKYVYHFVSLDDGRDVAITVDDTGLHTLLNRDDVVAFERVEGSRIVIMCRLPDRWFRYDFDLDVRVVKDERGVIPLKWRPAEPADLAEGGPGYTAIKYIEAITAYDLKEAAKWSSVSLLNEFRDANASSWRSVRNADLSHGIQISDGLTVMEADRCRIGIKYMRNGSWGGIQEFYFLKRDGRWIVVRRAEYTKGVLENG